jgi:F0F1-type ATP synthase assembly protein I
MQTKNYLRYSHLGLQFFIVFAGCFYGGYYLDKQWATSPWLTLSGFVVGFAASLWFLVKETQ